MIRGKRVTAGLLFTAIVVVAQVVIGATAAEARCSSLGHGTTSGLGSASAIVEERPLTGDCNGDHVYHGLLHRTTDTVAVAESVYTQDGGIWTRRLFTDALAPAEYDRFTYSDTNSHSLMTLCWYEYGDRPGSIGPAHCGWGANAAPTGQTPDNNPSLFNNDSRYHGVNAGF
jgi:hypothetical protein